MKLSGVCSWYKASYGSNLITKKALWKELYEYKWYSLELVKWYQLNHFVFCWSGEICGSCSDTVDILTPFPGWNEIDPDTLWEKTVKVFLIKDLYILCWQILENTFMKIIPDFQKY